MPVALKSVSINCTLKPSPAPSSTSRLLSDIDRELVKHGVETQPSIRIADLTIQPGVSSDEGNGDEWPGVRERILGSDILIFGTPIWMGHPSSFAQRVLERMDAFLAETDDAGRLVTYGRVRSSRPSETKMGRTT